MSHMFKRVAVVGAVTLIHNTAVYLEAESSLIGAQRPFHPKWKATELAAQKLSVSNGYHESNYHLPWFFVKGCTRMLGLRSKWSRDLDASVREKTDSVGSHSLDKPSIKIRESFISRGLDVLCPMVVASASMTIVGPGFMFGCIGLMVGYNRLSMIFHANEDVNLDVALCERDMLLSDPGLQMEYKRLKERVKELKG